MYKISVQLWRRGRDSNPCGVAPKRFSRPPRYDRFDTSPYMNCQKTDFIGYSIVLEILLEIHFCTAFGVPKKSGAARLFTVFASVSIANFQDRLVMTTSITLRIVQTHIIIPQIFDLSRVFAPFFHFIRSFYMSFLNNSKKM